VTRANPLRFSRSDGSQQAPPLTSSLGAFLSGAGATACHRCNQASQQPGHLKRPQPLCPAHARTFFFIGDVLAPLLVLGIEIDHHRLLSAQQLARTVQTSPISCHLVISFRLTPVCHSVLPNRPVTGFRSPAGRVDSCKFSYGSSVDLCSPSCWATALVGTKGCALVFFSFSAVSSLCLSLFISSSVPSWCTHQLTHQLDVRRAGTVSCSQSAE
jgi:hypothetical protein